MEYQYRWCGCLYRRIVTVYLIFTLYPLTVHSTQSLWSEYTSQPCSSGSSLKYLSGDALLDSPNCLGPNNAPYPSAAVARTFNSNWNTGGTRRGRMSQLPTLAPSVTQNVLLKAYGEANNEEAHGSRFELTPIAEAFKESELFAKFWEGVTAQTIPHLKQLPCKAHDWNKHCFRYKWEDATYCSQVTYYNVELCQECDNERKRLLDYHITDEMKSIGTRQGRMIVEWFIRYYVNITYYRNIDAMHYSFMNALAFYGMEVDEYPQEYFNIFKSKFIRQQHHDTLKRNIVTMGKTNLL